MDFNHCSCSGRSLRRTVQPAVMAILAKEPVHGYRVAQRLGQLRMFRDHRPDHTGIYRLLKSLEEGGFAVSTWDLADSGPARRLYRLTEQGKACLAQWIQTLEDYKRALAELLETMKAPV